MTSLSYDLLQRHHTIGYMLSVNVHIFSLHANVWVSMGQQKQSVFTHDAYTELFTVKILFAKNELYVYSHFQVF